MSGEFVLNEAAHAVWQAIADAGSLDFATIVEKTGVNQSQVAAAVSAASDAGHMLLQERQREELTPSPTAREALATGLPERRAAGHLATVGDALPMPDFIAWAKSEQVPPNEVFKWGAARGWIERGSQIALTAAGKLAIEKREDDERAIEFALQGRGTCFLDELPDSDIDPDRVRKLLSKRGELAKLKKRTERIASLTPSGTELLGSGIDVAKERSQLTPEDLQSGEWKAIKLRPYDVKLAAAEVYPAKIHPLRKIMEETRRAFLEMGFTEVVSSMVESAFWNFDALFQPQDHPARDMQDTFYMANPSQIPLPSEKIFGPVRDVHENGGDTGSEGWGYQWSEQVSQQVVLRTHTTAATIRALSQNPDPPGKYFCVGWTYRNETISFKHLPVFHQVDGIVIDEDASLASLLGTLQEFYSKMGFGKVKFKPAFYPYTEPSVDVVVYMESRQKWLEMGGAGIFRPEVTQPLGCRYPVLAWGLGVERLAMLRAGFSDIRELYRSNLDALEKVPLCR